MKIGKMYRYINAPKGEYGFGVYRGGETVVVLEKVYTRTVLRQNIFYKILLESGNIIDTFLREEEWEQVV